MNACVRVVVYGCNGPLQTSFDPPSLSTSVCKERLSTKAAELDNEQLQVRIEFFTYLLATLLETQREICTLSTNAHSLGHLLWCLLH